MFSILLPVRLEGERNKGVFEIAAICSSESPESSNF